MVFTMVDDIVVNKMLHEQGFGAFAPGYLDMVAKEVRAARKGRDLYSMYDSDRLFKARFMVFRYIMAWGFLTYFDLKPSVQGVIRGFVNTFEKYFTTQYRIAQPVKEVISANDIFAIEGHYEVVAEILKLWHLQDVVELRQC